MRCSNPPLPLIPVASNTHPDGWRPTFSRVVGRRIGVKRPETDAILSREDYHPEIPVHPRHLARSRRQATSTWKMLRIIFHAGRDCSFESLKRAVWRCIANLESLRWRVIVRRLREGGRGNFSHETMKFFYLNLLLWLERLCCVILLRQEGLRIYFLLVFFLVSCNTLLNKILRLSFSLRFWIVWVWCRF